MEGVTVDSAKKYLSTLKEIKPHAKAFKEAKSRQDWKTAGNEASLCASTLNAAATEIANADASVLGTAVVNLALVTAKVLIQTAIAEFIIRKAENEAHDDVIDEKTKKKVAAIRHANTEKEQADAKRAQDREKISRRYANDIKRWDGNRRDAQDALDEIGPNPTSPMDIKDKEFFTRALSRFAKKIEAITVERDAKLAEFDKSPSGKDEIDKNLAAQFNEIERDADQALGQIKKASGDARKGVLAVDAVEEAVALVKIAVKAKKSGKKFGQTTADTNTIVKQIVNSLRRRAKSYEKAAAKCRKQAGGSSAAQECWLFTE